MMMIMQKREKSICDAHLVKAMYMTAKIELNRRVIVWGL